MIELEFVVLNKQTETSIMNQSMKNVQNDIPSADVIIEIKFFTGRIMTVDEHDEQRKREWKQPEKKEKVVNS